MGEEDMDYTEDTTQNEEDFSETVVLDAKKSNTDNVGEASVEIDVDSLVAEFEAEASSGVDASGRIRRRLEALAERKRRHREMEDFADYDV